MKGQSLFSGKNKKKISKCLLKFLPGIESVKHFHSHHHICTTDLTHLMVSQFHSISLHGGNLIPLVYMVAI